MDEDPGFPWLYNAIFNHLKWNLSERIYQSWTLLRKNILIIRIHILSGEPWSRMIHDVMIHDISQTSVPSNASTWSWLKMGLPGLIMRRSGIMGPLIRWCCTCHWHSLNCLSHSLSLFVRKSRCAWTVAQCGDSRLSALPWRRTDTSILLIIMWIFII